MWASQFENHHAYVHLTVDNMYSHITGGTVITVLIIQCTLRDSRTLHMKPYRLQLTNNPQQTFANWYSYLPSNKANLKHLTINLINCYLRNSHIVPLCWVFIRLENAKVIELISRLNSKWVRDSCSADHCWTVTHKHRLVWIWGPWGEKWTCMSIDHWLSTLLDHFHNVFKESYCKFSRLHTWHLVLSFNIIQTYVLLIKFKITTKITPN